MQQYIDHDLLRLNNDETYHSSGGLGYTDELPQADFDGTVRPCDMWASAEAQEMAQVSPAMHAEFILPYERRLLAPFGLNGYGCCEDLADKMDDVLTIPNLRRVLDLAVRRCGALRRQAGARRHLLLETPPRPSGSVISTPTPFAPTSKRRSTMPRAVWSR